VVWVMAVSIFFTSIISTHGTPIGDPATTDFLIYGQLMQSIDHDIPSSTISDSPPAILRMFASRILPGPLQPVARIPRPDDPTPRKPPAYVTSNTAKRKRESSYSSIVPSEGLKRSKSMLVEDEQVRRAKEVMLNMPIAGPSNANSLKGSRSIKGPDAFKVPQLPARTGSSEAVLHEDVFNSVAEPSTKGKGKEVAEMPGSSELEKANKTVSCGLFCGRS
jgi:hypothetical protein